MRKRILLLVILMLALGLLLALPEGYTIIPSTVSGNTAISAMTFFETKLYYYDQKAFTLYLDDLEIDDIALAKKTILQLSPKAKIVDIHADREKIYLLDANARNIYVYEFGADKQAHLMTIINLQGVKELNFNGLKQITVNYLGYIYLLDATGIYSFSQEGMYMQYAPVSSPISMSLGEDQVLRVLSSTKLDYRLNHYDLNLNKKNNEIVIKEKPNELRILDFSVNRWGELQFLNSTKSLFINKYSDAGKLLPDTQVGFKSNRREILSFQNPVRIKCGQRVNYSLIAVLDNKHNGIHVFIDQNVLNLPDLERPTFAARVSLKKAGIKVLDYYAGEGASFVLQQTTPVVKSFKRLSPSGKEEYSIAHNKLKAKGVQDFSAIAGYGTDIYILDSRANKVHVFNASTGDYIRSFGGKGRQEDSFVKAVALAVDSEGMIYILDNVQKKISRYKKSEGYAGTINYNFVRNVSLTNQKEKALLLRVHGDKLFCLFADGSIWSIDKTSDKQQKLDLGAVKAKTFDFVYENDLAVIDMYSQKLYRYTGPKYGLKAKYFSIRASAPFPHFGQIQNLRYDPANSRLAIIDSQAEGMRYLNFYASLGDAPIPHMSLDAEGIVTLNWDMDSGINSWVIKKINDKDVLQEHVSMPEYKCQNPSSKPYSYTVRAIAADQKQSAESMMLTDYYSYANYLRQQKQYRDAIQAYERAQAILQDSRIKQQIINTYAEMAESFSAQGNYDCAHDALDEALKMEQNISLIEKKCELYSIESKYQKALELLLRVTPSYLDYEPLVWRYIRISYLAKNYDEVIRVAKLYRQKYTARWELYEYEAESYKKSGNIQEAIDVYTTINAKSPSFETELEISKLSIEMESYYEAQQRLSLLRQKYPGKITGEVSYLLGRCQLGLEVYGRAQEYFNEAIATDNKNPEYYYYLGLSYQKSGMLLEAKTNFKRAYELSPQNVEYGFGYAKLLHGEMATDAALQVMRSINEYIGTDMAAGDYHLLYAKILRDLKQYKEAMAEITKARNYRPDDFEINKLYTDIETDYRLDQGNLPPLQLQDLRVDKIYPALDRFYQKNPIGTVVLKNNRDNAIENVKINVQITGVGVEKEYIERIVPANSEKKIYLRADFSDAVFNLAGAKELRVSAKYNYMGEDQNAPLPAKSIEILPRGAMDWSNRSSLACFINPNEHYIGHFVQTNILPVFGGDSGSVQLKNKNILNAIKIYSFYSANGFQYVNDPSTSNQRHSALDNVKFPTETISSRSGDCEDFLVLFAASLEAIGISTALIDLPESSESSGHVMLAIDSQMNESEIRNSGLETDSFINFKNSYWIPLETTFMGKEGFIQAWLYAKRIYDESLSSPAPATLIAFGDAHESYPPSSFSRVYTGWDQSTTKKIESQREYNSEVSKLSNMGVENKLLQYLNTLEKYPDNLVYRLNFARELWLLGKKAEAEHQYNQVITRDPENYIANLHLGNICAESSRTEDARYYYHKALDKAESRQKDHIYLNLCILEYQNFNKQKAREYFNLLSDKRILQERERSIYLDLLNN